MFLRPCDPSGFHKDRYKATFGFKLSHQPGAKAPHLPFSNDAFPGLFDWAAGNYVMNGRKVPPFETWSDLTKAASIPSTRPAYVPAKLSYEDGSPLKKRRAAVATAGGAVPSGVFDLEDE